MNFGKHGVKKHEHAVILHDLANLKVI